MDHANIHADDQLDTGETGCGELLMLIFERMKKLQPGQVLQVFGYDPGAQIDVPAWCRMTGNPLLHVDIPPDNSRPVYFFIQKGNKSNG